MSAPDHDSTTNTDDGVVFLMDGSSTGLQTSTRRTLGTLGGVGGRQGAALVWADFNDDDFGNLAVGMPDADPPGENRALGCSRLAFASTNAGAVQVFYGSEEGLTEFLRKCCVRAPATSANKARVSAMGWKTTIDLDQR